MFFSHSQTANKNILLKKLFIGSPQDFGFAQKNHRKKGELKRTCVPPAVVSKNETFYDLVFKIFNKFS